MKEHVKQITKSASYALYRLSKIRRLLDDSTTEKLVHCFITSKIDYCNSILLGIDDCLIKRIQLLQNSAARLITHTRKFDHITPVMYSLHWLPVSERIEFKVLLITYKCLHGRGPDYLCDMIKPYVPPRPLRSGEKYEIVDYGKVNNYYGGRAFASAAPRLWNNLPIHIRSAPTLVNFKSTLKTYLFTRHYIS